MTKPLLTISHKSNVKQLSEALKKLKKSVVLVGIAKDSENDARADGGPNNHLLGFVHEFGSPAANIPARPFLVPGVESVKETIANGLGESMKAALKDDEKTSDDLLEKVGLQAVSGVKNYLTTADFEPLKPATIANRNRSRGTIGKREEEETGNGKIQPLINTGALRDAIDAYVVKE